MIRHYSLCCPKLYYDLFSCLDNTKSYFWYLEKTFTPMTNIIIFLKVLEISVGTSNLGRKENKNFHIPVLCVSLIPICKESTNL